MLMFSNRAYCLARKDKERLNEIVNEMGGEANVDVLWRELLRLLGEEVAALKAAFAEEVAAQEEKDAIERDACLAPAGETWEMLARQEMALDRSIDRKVKILLTMRKEHAQQCRGGSRTAPTGPATIPPEDQPDDREAQVAPTFRSARAGLKASATTARSESPKKENAGEISKSPEQSENVIENKRPAAEEVRA